VNSGETNFRLARLGFRQMAGATFSGIFFRHGLLARKITRKKNRALLRNAALQDCQMFLGTTCQNGRKIDQTTKNIPGGHEIFKMDNIPYQTKYRKIFQYPPLQDPPIFTNLFFFGVKIYQLATRLRDVFFFNSLFGLKQFVTYFC
jgi:hypothetical protein